ncbi:MAG: ArsR family transcriptional regulator [Thermotoga sp.]|nr:MAG: ArsR family transcriptional regulator [Thermotoga sp.]
MVVVKRGGFDLKSRYLKALACERRIEILEVLKRGEKSVCKLVEDLGVDQSVVSRHLKTLKESGIVDSRKKGVSVYYRIVDEGVLKVIDLITELLKRRARRFQDSVDKL